MSLGARSASAPHSSTNRRHASVDRVTDARRGCDDEPDDVTDRVVRSRPPPARIRPAPASAVAGRESERPTRARVSRARSSRARVRSRVARARERDVTLTHHSSRRRARRAAVGVRRRSMRVRGVGLQRTNASGHPGRRDGDATDNERIDRRGRQERGRGHGCFRRRRRGDGETLGVGGGVARGDQTKASFRAHRAAAARKETTRRRRRDASGDARR